MLIGNELIFVITKEIVKKEIIKKDKNTIPKDLKFDLMFNISLVEIINAASNELLLSINEKSADFLSVSGFSYDPLNPEEMDLDVDDLLWGNFKLNKNQMVEGNLVFKVKNSFVPKTFEWIESDRVIINFSQ